MLIKKKQVILPSGVKFPKECSLSHFSVSLSRLFFFARLFLLAFYNFSSFAMVHIVLPAQYFEDDRKCLIEKTQQEYESQKKREKKTYSKFLKLSTKKQKLVKKKKIISDELSSVEQEMCTYSHEWDDAIFQQKNLLEMLFALENK